MALKTPIRFGSLLRMFSSKLGHTFGNEKSATSKIRSLSNCIKLNKTERNIHEVMTRMADKFSLKNVSLHDMPNFLKLATSKFKYFELIKSFPLYSICQHKNEFDFDRGHVTLCPDQWYKKEGVNGPLKLSQNPYLDLPGSYCAGTSAKITGTDLSVFMKIMKFAKHLHNQGDVKELYDTMKSIDDLPYQLLPFDEVFGEKYWTAMNRNYVKVISDVNGNEEIDPVLTSKGLCYVWNGEKMSHVYQNSDYQRIFDGIFEYGNEEKKIQDGTIRKVTFLLDKHDSYLDDRKNNDQSFLVSVSSSSNYFDMISSTTLIPKGFHTIISTTPVTVKSDPDLRTKDLAKRKCRFPDEIPQNMTLFAKYSMKGCIFECMAKQARKFCMCQPWDMQNLDQIEDPELCDSAGNDCFWEQMANFSILGQTG